MVRWTAAALALFACLADAQIVAPPVQLPTLPLPTDELNRTVDGALRATEATEARTVRELRRMRIRELLQSNRTVLEADPRGAPIIRHEAAALNPSSEALDRARSEGFTVGRTRTLDGLGVTIVVLQAPAGMSTRRALRRLRQMDPSGVYDFNHVYMRSGEEAALGAFPAATAAETRVSFSGAETVRAKVGLIDGGVEPSHPVLRAVQVHAHGCAGGAVPTAHGTAVASLIAGSAEEFRGSAPGAEIYAADVYCGLATGGALDAIAEAFAWLALEGVPVINISLVGPPNGLLQQVVRAVVARGHIVVAAVGNDGPGSPPLYPAAYPEVIAVTGVDSRQRVLLEAVRGKHVDFAAPGADMSAASLEPTFSLVRGTSYAAPIVAGLLARELSSVDAARAEAAVAALAATARDLGARGRDRTYGDGLVGATVRPSERLAKADPF